MVLKDIQNFLVGKKNEKWQQMFVNDQEFFFFERETHKILSRG